MNPDPTADPSLPVKATRSESHTQLLLLPDGRVLAHNLTPAMAQVLQQLDPENRLLEQRCRPAADGSPGGSAPSAPFLKSTPP